MTSVMIVIGQYNYCECDWSVLLGDHMISCEPQIRDEEVNIFSRCVSPNTDPQSIDGHTPLHPRGQQDGRGSDPTEKHVRQ